MGTVEQKAGKTDKGSQNKDLEGKTERHPGLQRYNQGSGTGEEPAQQTFVSNSFLNLPNWHLLDIVRYDLDTPMFAG